MIPMYCLFLLISIFLLVSTVENHENWINVSRMGMKEHIAFPVEVKRGLRLRSGKKYLITVAITDDSPHLREKVKTTIDMLSLIKSTIESNLSSFHKVMLFWIMLLTRK